MNIFSDFILWKNRINPELRVLTFIKLKKYSFIGIKIQISYITFLFLIWNILSRQSYISWIYKPFYERSLRSLGETCKLNCRDGKRGMHGTWVTHVTRFHIFQRHGKIHFFRIFHGWIRVTLNKSLQRNLLFNSFRQFSDLQRHFTRFYFNVSRQKYFHRWENIHIHYI